LYFFTTAPNHIFDVVSKLKKPPHDQAHLVFAYTKANAEKPKELALPHRHPNRIFIFYTQFYEIFKTNWLY
jgi:hypothetical protein